MFNKQKTGELIVKPRVSPRLKLFVAALFAIGLLVAGGVIYNYGLSSAGFDSLRTARTKLQLLGEIRKLNKANEDLQQSLANAQRGLQMDQKAYQDLDLSLKASEKQIVKLREELNFYRNIISPPDKKSGVRIQSLQVESTDAENKFRYRLVLIQALKHDHTVYGKAQLQIIGMQAGKRVVVLHPGTKKRKIGFKFTYFKDIKGSLELPKNFRPTQVRVKVQATGTNKNLERVFNWQKVYSDRT
jgi:Family of unknown function (DUF6776)